MTTYSISWSPKSRVTYYKILQYLTEEWTLKDLENFIDRTEQIINLIAKNPSLYPYSGKSETHRCVVTKQISLFYRVQGNNVELLVFWDNRQNPAKMLLCTFYSLKHKTEAN